MSEKFALKWNDYQSNWNKSLFELRNDDDLSDVTLISDDKKKFSAHKILLSSCSSVFKFILKENKHANSLLYLGGVSSVNLGFILDYIYHGEVKIYQEQLDSFLESAQRLEISGLLGNSEEDSNNQQAFDHFQNDEERSDGVNISQTYIDEVNTALSLDQFQQAVEEKLVGNIESTPKDVTKFDVGNMSSEEVDLKIKELYQRNDGVQSCIVCDYSTKHGNIRQHIETHLDGLSFSCSFCNREFRSRNCLNVHKNKSHK